MALRAAAAFVWIVLTTPCAAQAVDKAPTGAIRAVPAQVLSPKLDLDPPPGLALALPPDPPAFVFPTAAAEPPPGTPAPEAADSLKTALGESLARWTSAPVVGHPLGAPDWNAARKAIAAVYAERADAPLWIEGEGFGPRARAALAQLARAGEDGLDLSSFPAPRAQGSPQALAEADIALSAAVVAYAMQASGARVRPSSLSKDVTAKPEVADPAFALKSVAAAPDPAAALAAFNPPQPGYRALKAALAQARGAAPEAVARFAPGPVLRLGMSDPRVPLIRVRFGVGADPRTAEVYDIRVASAVQAFQRIHGLKPDGALTEATASALDGGGGSASSRREKAILANMEMWRWAPREMGEVRVEVNVADYSLKVMSGDEVVHRTRVIVGKTDTPTPIFSNSIKYMLFNPVWRVPDSIIKKEMAPKLSSDPNYFARHGYKVSYVGDRLVVEQPPGEANALGRMLFLFPNEHAVYLHDTPGRGLFALDRRALSHGCVRVEDPARLAEILMGGAARGWTQARVRSLVGDKERTVSLPTPVPVHLQYFTAFVDEAGQMQEREDVYGLTAKVEQSLANIR